MKPKEHILYIDFIKGFTILLVILGHCIQFSNSNYDHDICFRYIYSFHMPLFMCISGFVSYKSIIKFGIIKKRAKQLLIPFFTWPLINGLFHLKIFSLNIYPEIIINPENGGLWFLWVLFFITVIFYLFNKLAVIIKIKQDYIIIMSAILLMSIHFTSTFNLFGYALISWYYLFYVIGFFMRKYSDQLLKFIDSKMTLWAFLFILAASFWMRKESPTFIHSSSHILIYSYKFIVAILGINASFSLCKRFIKPILR